MIGIISALRLRRDDRCARRRKTLACKSSHNVGGAASPIRAIVAECDCVAQHFPGPGNRMLEAAARQEPMIGAEYHAHSAIAREQIETEQRLPRSKPRDGRRPFFPSQIEIVEPQVGDVALDSADRKAQQFRLARKRPRGRISRVEDDSIKRRPRRLPGQR